jgi:hypothetical protein
MRLNARLKTLERPLERAARQKSLRLVVRHIGQPFDWAKVTCSRTLSPTGELFEVIHLGGSDKEIEKAELDRFVQKFPIQRL